LLRNHVETFVEYLKKSDSDLGLHRAFRKDLEGAKDVQQAFFPPQSFSIPGCLVRLFISRLAESEATITTSFLFRAGVGELPSVMRPEKELEQLC
jgi:hypothetical protein